MYSRGMEGIKITPSLLLSMNTSAPAYINESFPQFNYSSSHNNNHSTFSLEFSSCSRDLVGQTINNMDADKDRSAEDSVDSGGVKSNMTPLPLDFVPGDHDVLCGRGKKNYNSMAKLY